MMRILVIQTARLGDALQTSPLIRSIKGRYPGAHITFMVRRMSRPAAERHPDVDEVLVYDEDALYNHLCAEDSSRLLEAYRAAKALADDLRGRRFDLAFNATNTFPSALLLRLAGIKNVVGAHAASDGRLVLRGPWTNYFFTSVISRKYNDLNLCDILRAFVEDGPPCQQPVLTLRPEDRESARTILARHSPDSDQPRFCLQLGASHPAKQWPVESFAALATKLHKRLGARFFLTGVESERPLGEAFEQRAPNLAVPLYGKTSVPGLAALLEGSDGLITNDTGVMHVAAAVGCPVFLISIGPVHFRETGPYGAGHFALEHRDRNWDAPLAGESEWSNGPMPEPEAVAQAAEIFLARQRTDAARQLPPPPEHACLDLFASEFAPDGCLQWYPVYRRAIDGSDWLRQAYRGMWLSLHGNTPDVAADRVETIRHFLNRFDLPPLSEAAAAVRETSRVFQQLAEKAGGGEAETLQLVNHFRARGPMREARERVARLMRRDEEIRVFGEVNACCKPLALMARFERDNLEGTDPLVLAETTQRIYRDLRTRAEGVVHELDRITETWAGITGETTRLHAS